MERIRLNKYIASTGACSRRIADEYILEGRISINGHIVKELGTLVSCDDNVSLDGNTLSVENKKTYIMLNKPKGYISTAKEQFSRPSVMDIVKTEYRIYPVGRLDMYSRGLILLTNDGEITNKITHPKTHVSKTYEVIAKNEIKDTDVSRLKNGVDIDGYITKEAEVTRLSKNKIEITIFEGKNRQIRKMIEAIDNKVIDLKRTKIGSLSLNNLEEGKYVFLDQEEIKKIFE